MEVTTAALKEALSRAFEEGMFGYAEVKEEVVESLLAEVASSASKSWSSSDGQLSLSTTWSASPDSTLYWCSTTPPSPQNPSELV